MPDWFVMIKNLKLSFNNFTQRLVFSLSRQWFLGSLLSATTLNWIHCGLSFLQLLIFFLLILTLILPLELLQ